MIRVLSERLSISDNTTRLKGIIRAIAEVENIVDTSLKYTMGGRVTAGRRRVARAFGRSKIARIFKRNKSLRGAGY